MTVKDLIDKLKLYDESSEISFDYVFEKCALFAGDKVIIHEDDTYDWSEDVLEIYNSLPGGCSDCYKTKPDLYNFCKDLTEVCSCRECIQRFMVYKYLKERYEQKKEKTSTEIK